MGIVGAPPGLITEWRLLEPVYAGFRGEIGGRLDKDMAEGTFPGLHALLVIRHGAPVLERYFEGEDERWLTLSFKPRAYIEKGLRYGHQWWLGQLLSNGKPWHGAFGNGGQRLLGIPSLDMAVVVMTGNYNAPGQWKMPVKVISKIIIPSLLPA